MNQLLATAVILAPAVGFFAVMLREQLKQARRDKVLAYWKARYPDFN